MTSPNRKKTTINTNTLSVKMPRRLPIFVLLKKFITRFDYKNTLSFCKMPSNKIHNNKRKPKLRSIMKEYLKGNQIHHKIMSNELL